MSDVLRCCVCTKPVISGSQGLCPDCARVAEAVRGRPSIAAHFLKHQLGYRVIPLRPNTYVPPESFGD